MRAPEGGGQIADDTAETAIRGGRGSGKARRDPGGEEAFFPGLLMTKAGKEKRRRKEAARNPSLPPGGRASSMPKTLRKPEIGSERNLPKAVRQIR